MYNYSQIETELSKLDFEGNLLDYINVKDVCDDITHKTAPYDLIFDILNDGIFSEMGEVAYYGSAMEYLTQNDTSLRESLEIAEEHGYSPASLNSEILASLLKSRNIQESFCEIEDEINEIFENNQIKEEEEEK